MLTRLTRREMLRLTGLAAAGGFLAACCTPAGEPAADVATAPTEVPKVEATEETKEETTDVVEPPSGVSEGHVVVMHFLHEFTEDHVNISGGESRNHRRGA